MEMKKGIEKLRETKDEGGQRKRRGTKKEAAGITEKGELLI